MGLIFCRCNNEVIVTFLAGVKAPDKFRMNWGRDSSHNGSLL
ncbi:hypothetical protein EC54115_12516 [Escherichia coli 541-15]|nr:hypothetical protein EC54115_12516 [Escherichia coli 541-15]